VLLILAALGFGIGSLFCKNESYWQHLFIELSCGIATFLLTPLIIWWAGRSPTIARLVLALASITSGIVGYCHEGPLRLFAIEGTVMFGFLLGLELFIKQMFDRISSYFLGLREAR